MVTLDFSPVTSTPEVLGGILVFRGTRETLLDYQNDGFDVDQFLEFFPSVRRGDALEFLRLLRAS